MWYTFAPLGLDKNKGIMGVFSTWSAGLKTNRDAWTYSFSQDNVRDNMRKMIEVYCQELARWKKSDAQQNIDEFVVGDSTKISWSSKLKACLIRKLDVQFNVESTRIALYRPFCKQYVYYDSNLNDRQGQTPKLFPKGYNNIVIDVCDRGAIISSILPDLELMHHGQCFPMYWYEDKGNGKYQRHEAISDEALAIFCKIYPGAFTGRFIKDGGPGVRKEDIFYYIYGIMHSPEYYDRFATNLKKELPRVPMAEDFELFCAAGRALADLHLNYESAAMYPLTMEWNRSPDNGQLLIESFYNDPGPVEKLRWGKKRNPETGKMEADKSVLVYNERLTFRGIPEIAHRYVVNGRSPLEWMIDRYQVKTDPASGIVNDPNTYSDDPLYIANLVRRLVTVSVETMKIVDSLTSISEKDCYDDFPYEWKMHEQAPGSN